MHDREAGVYRYPEALPGPELSDEYIRWVGKREIPGEGEELARRCDQFATAIGHVRENGVSTRSGLITECCPEDNGGYSSTRDWYRRVVHSPAKVLEECTDGIELSRGEIRSPENIEPKPAPKTFADHVDRVAQTEVPGDGVESEARRDQFHAVVEFVQKWGIVSKEEIIGECCPGNDAGYSTAKRWYAQVVRTPVRALAERTGEIEVKDGELRFPESLLAEPETPETVEDHAIVVANDEIPGSGQLFRRRRRTFLDMLEYVKEKGSATRGELIERFYRPDSNLGYSSADSWDVRIVNGPFRALEERTSAIAREPGKIRYVK